MNTAILIPVLRRPHRVGPVIDSIRATTDAQVVFICDPNDHAERHAVYRDGRADLILDRAGNYATKINEAVRVTDTDYVFLAADDLDFREGWLEAAIGEMSPELGVGVVGTQDLCNPRVMRGEHSTHSLVARWYTKLGTIDDPSRLLHEEYPHEFVDDEFIQTARYRNAFAFSDRSVVEHLHPMNGKAPTDSLYAAIPARMRVGRRIYERRCKLWTSRS